MTNEHREAAVLVLAAGAGTRMRSDIPKVLHTLAGRSMLSHALHSVAKAAPAHLVVLLGHDRDRVAPAVAELAARATPWRAPCRRCPRTSPALSS
jgi:bifunctional UDP-N-acetylglucosamine pyrophosphorylase/glucosamine-1-phosphate N-acetyltransferase